MTKDQTILPNLPEFNWLYEYTSEEIGSEIAAAILKVNKTIDVFLSTFDFTCTLGADFMCCLDRNVIVYSLFTADQASKDFLTFVSDLFPEIHADIFLWSLLHEVGHIETADDFDDMEWAYYRDSISQKIGNFEYFDLPIERAATEWAGHYILTHTAEIAILWSNIRRDIVNLYSILRKDGIIE